LATKLAPIIEQRPVVFYHDRLLQFLLQFLGKMRAAYQARRQVQAVHQRNCELDKLATMQPETAGARQCPLQ